MEIIAGRNYRPNIAADSNSYIINEAAVESFGWGNAEVAINKPFSVNLVSGKVIGVVKNFNFNSLLNKLNRLLLYPGFPSTILQTL